MTDGLPSPTTFFKVQSQCQTSRARAGRIRLKHGTVDTPVFMPVGTQGTMKAITSKQLKNELNAEIILANTYHLAHKPGTEVLEKTKGLHNFMNFHRNILTDSGGFQMVSLNKFATFSEEGVSFAYPHDEERILMLTPERCMEIQNSINSDIMMQLDDVVVTTSKDKERNTLATKRSIRWLDRAYDYLLDSKVDTENRPKPCKIAKSVEFADLNSKKYKNYFNKQVDVKLDDRPNQVLYPITQGVLDLELRQECLAELNQNLNRSRKIEGGAIGGLSGGEEKEDFCKVVLFSTAKLPSYRPRYVMGIGFPIDLIMCVAMGCDQFDCVWPTRIARMGIVLVRDPRRMVDLSKSLESSYYKQENENGKICQKEREKKLLTNPLDPKCPCSTCKTHNFGYLRILVKNQHPSFCNLLSIHNLAHHKNLMNQIRQAILEQKFPEFVQSYLDEVQYYPKWALDALEKVCIKIVVPEGCKINETDTPGKIPDSPVEEVKINLDGGKISKEKTKKTKK